MNIPFVLRLLIAWVAVEIICWLIKMIYRKDRPAPQARVSFFENIDANSFPSIHTARASVIACSLFFFYQDVLFFMIGAILILGVGYSRIFLKKHYFIDVVAGALIGILIATIISFVIL